MKIIVGIMGDICWIQLLNILTRHKCGDYQLFLRNKILNCVLLTNNFR